MRFRNNNLGLLLPTCCYSDFPRVIVIIVYIEHYEALQLHETIYGDAVGTLLLVKLVQM